MDPQVRGTRLLLAASTALVVLTLGGILVLPFLFPSVALIVALEVGVGVLALALTWSASTTGRALLLVVAAIALSGLWFTVVDAETGGANEYALAYWIFIGFPLMTLLAFLALFEAREGSRESRGTDGR